MTDCGPHRTWRKPLKKALVLLAAAVYAFHLYLLWVLGIASVFTSLMFFSTIAFLTFVGSRFLFGKLHLNPLMRRRLWLCLGSLFLSILGADLYLRYGVARYASHEEEIGMFYAPVYKSALALRIAAWHRSSARLYIRPSNLHFTHRQNEFSYEFFTNSEGIRDREHPEKKPPGEFRIIAVGDSFTEGVGAEFESTWPQQLERLLNQESRRFHIRLIGGGVRGSDPFFEYVLLKERLLSYDPDVVIVAINGSDLYDTEVRGGMDRFRDDGSVVFRKGPSWEWIYACSYLLRHVVHDVLGYDRFLIRPEERAARKREALDELWAVLQSFWALSNEKGFKLLVVIHPLSSEVLANESELSDLLRRLEKDGKIPTLDLLKYFERVADMTEGNLSEFYWPQDGHHTPRGYRLFAEGVAERILQLGWLPTD